MIGINGCWAWTFLENFFLLFSHPFEGDSSRSLFDPQKDTIRLHYAVKIEMFLMTEKLGRVVG